ncbi:universal stress protein UspA [Streptomyces lunaelactis]|uniref:Universal stress protein UspA n=1 Tax=Streptomyces lunaelactis TaxID=1535768 RepID=A0A2R4T4Z3_9ACTN|nr:universal stress protein [Streptomyces lunaelactis]AVZ74205.1 universal stress protein UspA [Streptomyces lunaelactis]NUK87112.1 universal stress protein [Streptomyces lunaelactis]NUL05035.1 universal stress protein [Streptomyces lunaelactis]
MADAGRIVVGVDGSEPSLRALRWAVRQSALTGETLEAVISWEYPAAGWAAMVPGVPEDFNPEALAAQILDDSLVETLGAEAAAKITHTVLIGNAAQALMDRAGGAALLVVGNHGYSGFRATLLGSVGLHLAQHAPCPVVVVRGGSDSD